MTCYLAHDIPILLLNETLVVLQRGAPSCEGELFLLTIREQQVIDKLSPIVGVHPQKRKGKACARLLQGFQGGFLALVQQWHAFGPAGGNIRERQGGEIASFDV